MSTPEKPNAERLLVARWRELADSAGCYEETARKIGMELKAEEHRKIKLTVTKCADELEAVLATAQPNPFIVNAVRLAYYTGDFKGAINVIAEAVGENVVVPDKETK